MPGASLMTERACHRTLQVCVCTPDSMGKVEGGGRLVEQTGKTLHDIVISVKKVSDIVAEMTAATREQATGIDQVNQSILQMDQVTQQNAALVEQTAAASQSMSEQATHLQTLMSSFKLQSHASIQHHSQPRPVTQLRSIPAQSRPVAPLPAQAAVKHQPVRRPLSSPALAGRAAPTAPVEATDWEEF